MADFVEKIGTQVLTSVGLVAAGIIAAYIEALTAAGRRKRALDEGLKTLGFVETWLKVRQQVGPEMDADTSRAIGQALDDVFRRAVQPDPIVAPTGVRRLLLLHPPAQPWRWTFQLPFYFAVALLIVTTAGGVLRPSLWDEKMALLLLLLLGLAAVFRFAATWRAP